MTDGPSDSLWSTASGHRIVVAVFAVCLLLGFVAPSIARAQSCSTADPPADIDPSTLDWSSDQAIQTNFTNARLAEDCSTPMTLPTGFDSMSPQQQTLWLFNSEREVRGLSDLQLDSTLISQIALNHSMEMAQYGYFEHPSPINQVGTFPWEPGGRLTVNPALAPASGLGENIVSYADFPQAEPESVFVPKGVFWYMYDDSGSAWGHRVNILASFNWVGIGIALNAAGTQWYNTDDFVNIAGYTSPATADTNPPVMSQISYSNGTATVTGVADNPNNVNNTGANPATAAITQVVFYTNQIIDTNGSFNTVVATETAPGSGTWTASITLNPTDVLHAVAVDGSGNYTDMTMATTS